MRRSDSLKPHVIGFLFVSYTFNIGLLHYLSLNFSFLPFTLTSLLSHLLTVLSFSAVFLIFPLFSPSHLRCSTSLPSSSLSLIFCLLNSSLTLPFIHSFWNNSHSSQAAGIRAVQNLLAHWLCNPPGFVWKHRLLQRRVVEPPELNFRVRNHFGK